MTPNQSPNKAAFWFARLSVALVFILNVQSALAFFLFPETYSGAYELSGIPGAAALQGFAITFLMWNVTYPFVIANPYKNRTVFIIVLIQQTIGLIGESLIFFGVGNGHALLSTSILRFVIFDGAGLILMSAAFIVLERTRKSARSEIPSKAL